MIKKAIQFISVTGFLLSSVSAVHAQLLSSSVNMGLGGGGTASTTGYESLFINPANLLIQEKDYQLQAGFGSLGIHLNSPVATSGSGDIFPVWYLNQTRGFSPESSQPVRNPMSVLDRNYRNDRLLSEHYTRGELMWFGFHWRRPEKGFAVALRTRYSSRYLVGRHYYDAEPVETDTHFEINRSLTHQFQSFHELSFGYAETFTYINGLIPQLSRLIVGVAPKLILSGAYSNMEYTDISQSESAGTSYENRTNYSMASSGTFSTSMPFGYGLSPGGPGWDNPARKSLFKPTGLGVGFDFGVTYLITLGDDLSAIGISQETTNKSLRVSLAVTDIGIIRYTDNPYQSSWSNQRTETSEESNPSDILFTGRPGEHFHFLSQEDAHPQEDSETVSEEPFSVLLPTTLHAGTLFQLNRVKLSGDISLGLTNNAFNTTKFITYLGTEIRVLPFLPVRAGTRLAINLPGYYSFGGGIETETFEFNLAFQLRSKSSGPTSELSGSSIAALTVYLR